MKVKEKEGEEEEEEEEKQSKRVRVAIRCRPVNESDGERKGVELGVKSVLLVDDNQRYEFDDVFGEEASQVDVYKKVVEPILRSCVSCGWNGSIIAYGQTGTGKTYTMGILDRLRCNNNGVIPMALEEVFGLLDKRRIVRLSFVQLYMDGLQDLLAPVAGGSASKRLNLREDPRVGFYVEGLECVRVRNFREACSLVNLGLENRTLSCTAMNTSSSRSHIVLTVECEGEEGKTGFKLRFVDLAGSERLGQSLSKPNSKQQKEARSINVSLSALGNVVAALAQREVRGDMSTESCSSSSSEKHVPFRDSKLTRLLQDTLAGKCGGCNAALIATIGPSAKYVRETMSTLKFASRCMKVRIARSVVARSSKHDWKYREAELRQRYESRILELESKLARSSTSDAFYDMYTSMLKVASAYTQRLEISQVSARVEQALKQPIEARFFRLDLLPYGTPCETLVFHAKVVLSAIQFQMDDLYLNRNGLHQDLQECSQIMRFLLQSNAHLRTQLNAVPTFTEKL